MVIATSLRLFRFLLSLVVRLSRLSLNLSTGRVVLTFRSWFASLWRTFARCRGQTWTRLHCANDVPVVSDPLGGQSQRVSERAKAKEDQEHNGTLATLPVWLSTTSWEETLSKLRARTYRLRVQPTPVPTIPDRGSQRYETRTAIQVTDPELHIPPGQQKLLSSLPQLTDGWRRHVHPEGVVFFYHEGFRIFTESDITDHKNEEEILFCATKLVEKAMQTDGVTLDALTEVVLNVDDDRCWHYYFADHTHRLLFWVDTVSMKDLDVDLHGISEYSHIRYMVEAHYWYAFPAGPSGMPVPLAFYPGTDPNKYIPYDMGSRSHCEYYPHNRTLPQGAFEELRGMLNYAKTDMMTTDSSSSPFGQDELVAILDLVNSLKDDEKISDPYSIWLVARLMAYFTENQFLNFCGQPCARLNADTPLFGQPTWNRLILFRIVNLFLFGSPNEHAVRLQRVWVDGIIIQPRWKDFINRLTSELGRYTIFSTVMLAVNFSFLAVPGVVNPASTAGPIPIIIYCSVVSTIASIVYSFGLLNVYTNPELLVARNAVEAMWTLSQSKSGMAWLAITHSLPVASLIWSITLFSAALAVQIFGPKEPATVATLSIECFIIVSFVVMGVRAMRLFSRNDDGGDDVDTPTDKSPPMAGSKHDVEQG